MSFGHGSIKSWAELSSFLLFFYLQEVMLDPVMTIVSSHSL